MLVAEPGEPAVRVVRQADLGPDQRMRAYRMTELDEAVDHAARIGGVAPSRVALPSFEVLDPSVLRHDPLPAALWDAVRKIDGVVARAVPRLDAATIELFCDLEETRDPYGKPDPHVVAAAVAALAAGTAACLPDLATACAEPALVARRWGAEPAPAPAPGR